MVFAFGADSPNAVQDFDIQKRIAKEMLKSINISPEETRVGFVTYGRNARISARLTDYADYSSVQRFLDTLRNPGVGNRVDKALEVMKTALLSEAAGARKGVAKTVVVFLNKQPSVSPLSDIKNLFRAGVKVIVFGVGETVNAADLKSSLQTREDPFLVRKLDDVRKVAGSVAKNSVLGKFASYVYNILATCLLNGLFQFLPILGMELKFQALSERIEFHGVSP